MKVLNCLFSDKGIPLGHGRIGKPYMYALRLQIDVRDANAADFRRTKSSVLAEVVCEPDTSVTALNQ